MEKIMSDFTYVGREVLYTREKEINEKNVADVLARVLPIYEKNKAQSNYLYWYYRGAQPILDRVKKIRPEINNKIVENHANEIVSFKKGFSFGEPVQYVRRAVEDHGNTDPAGDNGEGIMYLNKIMAAEDKAASDEALAEWFFICGTAYRMILPKGEDDGESPIEMETLDARYTGVFVEFGTGIVGSKAPHPTSGEHGYSYDTNGHGNDGWYYFDEKGNRIRWTRGMPSRPFMFETAVELSESIEDTAREVFSR